MTRGLWIITSVFFLMSCNSSTKIEQLPSANSSYRIKSLIMHFTAVDYANSKRLLVEEGGLSAHYLIPQRNDPSYPHKTLKVIQLVNENERAWHAGVSHWQGRNGLNDSSIGIEIVNVPQCNELIEHAEDEHHAPVLSDKHVKPFCIYPDFDPLQIELLIELSRDILSRNPDISPTAVVGHSDIAPSRKHDPGPRFPWYQLYQNGIGAWYDNATIAKYWRLFKQVPLSTKLLQQALRDYGYDLKPSGEFNQITYDTIEAFQMHFLPWQVTGVNNPRTSAAIMALLEKYFPNKAKAILDQYERDNIDEMRSVSPSSAKVAEPKGQINGTFPLQYESSRSAVENKVRFKAYEGRGEINILSTQPTSADFYVNGQKLTLDKLFSENVQYQYSLGKRTQDGVNTLFIDNINPPDARLMINIPYPSLAYEIDSKTKGDFARLDELIENEIENGFPGLALLVAHKGKVIKKEAWGHAKKFDAKGNELTQPLAMKPSSLFDLASNTKTVGTTLAIMHLAYQGIIDVNAQVIDYLPEFSGDLREMIKVKDLLRHNTGFPSDVKFFDNNETVNNGLFSQNRIHTHFLITQRLSPSVNNLIDQYSSYSDINFMILGMLIERVTGQTLDKYIEKTIMASLGLKNTLFNPLEKGVALENIAATELAGNTRGGLVNFINIRTDVIHGEVHDEKAFYSMQGVSGHAGLFSNLDDLSVIAQLILNKGGYGNTRLFDEDIYREFLTSKNASEEYALGWKKATEQNRWMFGPYASSQAIGHSGWTGTLLIIDPQHDLVIVMLTNKKHSPITINDTRVEFAGDHYELGKYGSIASLIYEAILH